MAKAPKQHKGDIPNPKSVANRDVMQRLNFLYQASVYLNSIPSSVEHGSSPEEQIPTASTSTTKAPDQSRNHGSRKSTSAADLSRSYVEAMKSIGQKTVVKMDPTVKRTLCKGCGAILIPGSTATVRIKPSSSHRHAITYTCIRCKTSRRIPAPPVLHSQSANHHSSEVLSESPKVVDNQMDIDHDTQAVARGPNFNQKTRKKGPIARRQPLFQQPGHILFRGNEQIAEEDETL